MSLFLLENLLLVGNYQRVINLAPNVKSSDEHDIMRKQIYLYRAYIEQGRADSVVDEVSYDATASKSLGLQAVALVAKSKLEGEEAVRDSVLSMLSIPNLSGDADAQVLIGLLLLSLGEIEKAHGLLSICPSAEAQLIIVNIYLSMNRPEAARKQCRIISEERGGDSVYSLLACCWIACYASDDSNALEESITDFQHLSETYGETAYLLNQLACCHIKLHAFERAEHILGQALVLEPRNAVSRSNMLLCCRRMLMSKERMSREERQLDSLKNSVNVLVAREQILGEISEIL